MRSEEVGDDVGPPLGKALVLSAGPDRVGVVIDIDIVAGYRASVEETALSSPSIRDWILRRSNVKVTSLGIFSTI